MFAYPVPDTTTPLSIIMITKLALLISTMLLVGVNTNIDHCDNYNACTDDSFDISLGCLQYWSIVMAQMLALMILVWLQTPANALLMPLVLGANTSNDCDMHEPRSTVIFSPDVNIFTFIKTHGVQHIYWEFVMQYKKITCTPPGVMKSKTVMITMHALLILVQFLWMLLNTDKILVPVTAAT